MTYIARQFLEASKIDLHITDPDRLAFDFAIVTYGVIHSPLINLIH